MFHPQFPCPSLPAEPSTARLLGLYPQRQAGRWMQRIRVPGGRLSALQWSVLARIAREFTPHEPLHLTTRQDVEIHGLTAPTVPPAQRLLVEAGLTGVGACGDTIRNVTVCPCSGIAPGAPDLLPLARRMTELLQGQAGAFALPRKFKISLSACENGCGQPWINDVGFVAVRHGADWQFQAVVAGSMGPRPSTGIAYRRLLLSEEILPFALAALRVFVAQGDREHRYMARLRHVRQRVGNDVFLNLLDGAFAAVQQERVWPAIPLATATPVRTARAVLRFDEGNMTVTDAEILADLAGRRDLTVVVGNHHQVFVFATDQRVLDAALGEVGLRPAPPGPRVVACPGIRWCARGQADTVALALAVRRRLEQREAGDVLIGISGCPNGCAHSGVAPVGAVGVASGSTEQRKQAWNLLAGGESGLGPTLAQPVANRLSLEDAADRIIELALQASAATSGSKE